MRWASRVDDNQAEVVEAQRLLASPAFPASLPTKLVDVERLCRAAGLCPFLRRLQLFSTTGHPTALVACYAVAWPLLRPHSLWDRLADDSLSGHTMWG